MPAQLKEIKPIMSSSGPALSVSAKNIYMESRNIREERWHGLLKRPALLWWVTGRPCSQNELKESPVYMSQKNVYFPSSQIPHSANKHLSFLAFWFGFVLTFAFSVVKANFPEFLL